MLWQDGSNSIPEVEQGTVCQWKTGNGFEVVKILSKDEKDGLRSNSIQAGTYVA
jgi:hypothetical protein